MPAEKSVKFGTNRHVDHAEHVSSLSMCTTSGTAMCVFGTGARVSIYAFCIGIEWVYYNGGAKILPLAA